MCKRGSSLWNGQLYVTAEDSWEQLVPVSAATVITFTSLYLVNNTTTSKWLLPPQQNLQKWQELTTLETPGKFCINFWVKFWYHYGLLHPLRLAKGMATSIEERQLLGIHGLLPPRYMIYFMSKFQNVSTSYLVWYFIQNIFGIFQS